MLVDKSILGRLKELGLSIAKPGEDVVTELVVLYRRDSQSQLDRLVAKTDVDRRGLAALSDTAHALKGASLAVGATSVAELAKMLELAAKADDVDAVDGLIERIESALIQTWDILDAIARGSIDIA